MAQESKKMKVSKFLENEVEFVDLRGGRRRLSGFKGRSTFKIPKILGKDRVNVAPGLTEPDRPQCQAARPRGGRPA